MPCLKKLYSLSPKSTMRPGEKSRNFLAHFLTKKNSQLPSVIRAFTFSAGMLKDGGRRETWVMQKQLYFGFRKSKEVKAESEFPLEC